MASQADRSPAPPAPPMPPAPLRTRQLCVGHLEENCYLLWREGGASAVVFDPGAEAGRIQRELEERRLTPAAFVQTHCHGDHIGALRPLKTAFPEAPLCVPEAEKKWLAKPLLNLSYFVGRNVTAPEPERLVRDGEVLEFIGLKLKAIHVPGHSPGSTAFYTEDPAGGVPHLFGGDILFQHSIGRTDLPGGAGAAGAARLIEGIRKKLFVLPDATLVHPGHGPETTIGAEKSGNPFCGLGEVAGA